MARPLILLHRLSSSSQAGYLAGTVLLCAFALFACVSHSRKWRRHWRACYEYDYGDRDPVIQLNNQEMVPGFQFGGNAEGSMASGDVSVWQKNILMGGKCQLPDFSGVIIYDAAGNVVPRAKAPLALPWK